MNKRKREEIKNKPLDKEEDEDLEEAIEARIDIEDEEKSASSEEEGEDLMKDMEK